MEGMGTEAFAMAPFFWSGKAHGQQRTPICSLAPSHHGEAGAARPSSAEAFSVLLSTKGSLYVMERKRALTGSINNSKRESCEL